jgi:ketosteroid isomerase-like protein
MTIRAMAQTATTPQQFLDLWGKAWDNHDVDAIMRLHAEDCVTVNRFGVVTRGKDPTRRAVTWLHSGPFKNAHFGAPKLLMQRKIAPGLVVIEASWKNPSGRTAPAASDDDLVLTVMLRDADQDGWVAEQIDVHTVDALAPGTVPEETANR